MGGQGGTEGLPPEPASATSASQAVFRSPRESAATAARREPLGPAAPPLSPRVLDPGLPLLPAEKKKKKKKACFPRDACSPVQAFRGHSPGAQAGASSYSPEARRGRLRSRSGPPTCPVGGVTYKAVTCAATSRRASAPPLVTRPARGLPPAGAQPRSPAEPRAPAAARRSPASPPGLREGRLAASSRVLGDRETVAVVSPLQI